MSRGAVPRVGPRGLPSKLVRLGYENLGFDVVVAVQQRLWRLRWLLTALLERRQQPLVQGGHGDSFPFRPVAQRGCRHSVGRAHPKPFIVAAILSLKSPGNANGIVMTTRIFMTDRLLDYALTGTTDSEHWH